MYVNRKNCYSLDNFSNAHNIRCNCKTKKYSSYLRVTLKIFWTENFFNNLLTIISVKLNLRNNYHIIDDYKFRKKKKTLL